MAEALLVVTITYTCYLPWMSQVSDFWLKSKKVRHSSVVAKFEFTRRLGHGARDRQTRSTREAASVVKLLDVEWETPLPTHGSTDLIKPRPAWRFTHVSDATHTTNNRSPFKWRRPPAAQGCPIPFTVSDVQTQMLQKGAMRSSPSYSLVFCSALHY